MWEPAGRALLAKLPAGDGLRALDVGCGALGWLRLLSAWVGPSGSVVGTDVDPRLLGAAAAQVEHDGLANVRVVTDDLFASALPEASFDLVHARFLLAPLGAAPRQIAAYLRLLKPGGVLVLEDPDSASWHFNPPADAAERLVALVRAAFKMNGGDLDMGRALPRLLAEAGINVDVDAHVLALPPGHPYLRLPLQFARSLEPTLLKLASAADLAGLLELAEAETSEPKRWGTTFTLVQAWGRKPA